MKQFNFILSVALALWGGSVEMQAQSSFSLVSQTLSNPENEPRPVFPVPTDRQLKWQQTEFYAFFHFGMNTFTGLEWGNGDESESQYAPTAKPNPEQWLSVVKEAGMKGGIAVVKHHDGFCLWPTTTTTHNMTRGGNAYARETNIPLEFANAARKLDMKYGFYVSPWDRNSALYGTDSYVKDVFLRQCAELAQYGDDQFEMWFDGANGGSGYYGGKNTTINIDNSTYYDIPNLRDSIHKLCPNIILWGVGGEARWIGNEAGWAGETNWSPYNYGWAGEAAGMYGAEDGWYWFPGESDAKFTDRGWFYHEGESPLSPERTFQMYLETVGRNATLILNCPPDKSGSLPSATVSALRRFGAMLKARLGTDLAKQAVVTASDTRTAGSTRNYGVANLTDDQYDTYWATNDGQNTAVIELTWETPQTVRYVMLQENIALGQRVKAFQIEVSEDGTSFTKVGGNVQTTTVGYKRIIPLNGSTNSSYGVGYKAKKLRVTILDSKACPTLSTLSVF